MNIRKSLSLKLFITIFMVFVVMVSCIVIFINVYFNNFYEDIKIQNTINNINTFAGKYEINNWNNEELYRELNIFSSENNSKVSVKNEESEESSDKENHGEENKKLVLITTVDESNRYIDFFLAKEDFDQLKIKKGSNISISGSYGENDIINVKSINDMIIASNNESTNEEGKAEEGGEHKKNYKGKVTVLDIKENLVLPMNEEEGEAKYNALESKKVDGVRYKISEIPHTGIKEVVFTKVLGKETTGFSLVVTTSLQPIMEVVKVVQGFYPIFFIGSLVLAFLISIVYAWGVTKPIKRITNVADEMANMRFDKRLEVKREDELGGLSNSLNILSNNLEGALNDLTDANEQLKLDYERELKQERSRKEFVANVSHELKTPLGIIKSYSEGIKDNINTAERDSYIDTISEEIKRMDRLISEMLRISRYDSMDMELIKEEEDMHLVINDSIQGFEKQMHNKNLKLDIKGDFSTCLIDVEKVSTAFKNLFSNAVKYAQEASTIIISGIKKKSTLRVEIYNDYRGFSDEEIERIWERFYRVDTSHNKDIEGTGLGLAIVKSIFKTHGIKYGVENKDNGVSFWFEINSCRDELE